MALTDNRTLLNDCEDDAQTFTTSGAQLGTESAATGLIFQGSASVDVQHSDNNDRTSTTGDSAGSTFNVNMADMTFYLVTKDNLVDTFAASVGGNGGQQIVLGDGTDLIGYPVGGSDARGLPLRRQFNAFKLDVSEVVATPPGNEAVYAGSEAALTQTAITEVGYGSLHSSKAAGAIVNLWIDGLYYIANDSYALSITGGTIGTPETMTDAVGDDETSGIGLVNNPKGAEFGFFGPTETGAASPLTADSYFTTTDEQWYFIGDNSGGHPVGDTHFPFRLVGNTTGTNSFVATRTVIVNIGTRAEFDLSHADMDIVKFTSCTFTDLGTITCPLQDVGNKFINDTVFNNCAQVITSTLDMEGCTFNGSLDANGAVYWDEADDPDGPVDQANFTFNSDGTGNAIEVNPTGAGPFVYTIDGYLFDAYATQLGTDTDRVFFINPVTLSADITINLTNSSATNSVGGGSDVFSHRDVGSYTGTLLIQQTVSIVIQVNDEDGNGISGAKVRVEESPGGTIIVEGTADGTGEFSTSTTHSVPQAITIKSRLKGFKNFRTGGTLVAAGLASSITMRTDNEVDLP